MLRQRGFLRKFVSFGFAGFIEPAQPQGGLKYPCSRYICNIQDAVLIHCNRKFCMASPSLLNSRIKQNLNSSYCGADHSGNSQLCQPVTSCILSNSIIKRDLKIWPFQNKSKKSDEQKTLDKENEDIDGDESNLTLFQRFKTTYKKHGKTLFAVHITTSVVWFGGFYYIARSGIDIVSWMEYYNLSPKIIWPFKRGGLGDIAVMYLLYKLATPLRYAVTLGGTNLSIRYLKSTGYIEQVSPEDSIRNLMRDGSDILKEKKSDFVEQSKTKIRSIRDKDTDR